MKRRNIVMNTERPNDLIFGLRNIARFVGEDPATLSREIARGSWPVVTLGGGTFVANPPKLLAAKAAREAARARGELYVVERRVKQRRKALEPAREMEEAV
jgi:hypothetical protein